MKRAIAIAIADRAASFSLRLLGLLNLIFLAAFYFAMLFAVSQAQASEEITCSGEDMLAQMERDNPQALQGIRDEAAKVENGGALLWRIEKEGAAPSYLFGTMHVSDPRVVRLPDAAQQAFDGADTVVIETTDILDQSKMMQAMAQKPDLMMFTDGTTLFSLLSETDRAALEAGLKARNIPPASVAKMKPWMIAAMVALPACELQRKSKGAPVLDAKLAHDGKEAGKAIGGLETAMDQLEAMASLPMDFHLRGLVETISLGDKTDDVIETMVQLYLREETASFWPFFRVALPEQDKDGGFADFEERLITARNHTMAKNAVAFLDKGNAFIAVGAMHLPGEEGVIALLRKDGYHVEKVSAEPVPLVGGDVDEHGCKPSAGYQWCAKTAQCERSWELAAEHGFENSAEGFAAFCGN